MTVQKVEFGSLGLTLVGDIYLPQGFDESKQYKTIVVTPPAHQIKEQTAAEPTRLALTIHSTSLAYSKIKSV